MSQQENINSVLSKMTEALQMVKECEALMLEEIKQIEELQEEKNRLGEQIATLNDELLLIQKDLEEIKAAKALEVEAKEEDTEIAPAPVVEPTPVVEAPIPVVVPTMPVVEPPAPAAEKQGVETIADKFHGQPSVHDKIAAQPEITTTGTRVNDIIKAISINDRLLFIKELFGKAEVFTQTVKYLNSLQNFDEAQQYLNEAFPHWDNAGSAAQLFISIVRRRYL